MERDTRFELALLVWRTNVLPLTLIPHLKETLGTLFYKFNTFYKIYLTLLCVPTNTKNYQYLFYPRLKGLAREARFELTNTGVWSQKFDLNKYLLEFFMGFYAHFLKVIIPLYYSAKVLCLTAWLFPYIKSHISETLLY